MSLDPSMLCTQSAAHLGLLGVSRRESAVSLMRLRVTTPPAFLLPKTKAQLGCGTVLEPLLARQPQRQGHGFGNGRLAVLPRYPVETALRLQPGVTPHAASSARSWAAGLVLLQAGSQTQVYPWRANGLPMCAMPRAARRWSGP
jgi:hypothetical protein